MGQGLFCRFHGHSIVATLVNLFKPWSKEDEYVQPTQQENESLVNFLLISLYIDSGFGSLCIML